MYQYLVKRSVSPACLVGRAMLALLFVVISTGCASRATRAQRSFEGGKRYFERQKFAEAAIEFQKSLKRNPESWESRYYLGLTQVKLGELREAYRNLNAAVELQPSFVPAHLELADLFVMGGKTEEARQQVSVAQSLDPKNARAQTVLARSYLVDKDFPRAVLEFEKAKQLSPGDALVWGQCGLAEIGTKQFALAEKDFRRALDLAPDDSENYRNLANLLRATSRSQEVEPFLRRSIEAHPKTLELNLMLADYFFQAGRQEDADRLLNNLQSRAEDFSNFNLQVGDFWMWKGEPGRAVKAFEAEHAKKADLLVQKKLISAYLALGRTNDAERLNMAVLKKDAHDLEGRAFNGALAYTRGDYSTATEQLQSVLKDDPQSLIASYYLGLSWIALDKPERAKSAFFDCVRLNDKFLQAYLRLGDLSLSAQDWQAALEYGKKAIEISPRLEDGYLLQAQAYMMKGDLNRAESILKPGEKSPDAPAGWHEALARLYSLKKNEIAATAQYEQALARSDEPLVTLTRYTDFLAQHGRGPAAIERVKQWVATNPPQASAYELLANISLREQDYAGAEAACRKALALEPQLPVPHFWLGEILEQQGKPEEALEQYNESIRLSPKDIPAYIVAGNLLSAQGQYEKGKAYFERALGQDPGAPAAQYALARWYGDRSENLDVALSMAQELKKNLPKDPQTSDLLGWIYYQKGVYRPALDQLLPAAAALPNDALVQYHLGMTYSQIGETNKARQALSHALKLGLTPTSLASKAEEELKKLVSG